MVVVPGSALAKGPTDARVEGPGLAEPIALDWEQNEAELSALIDASGFWELSDRPVADEPAGDLGPRFVVSYSVNDDVGAPSRCPELADHPVANGRARRHRPARDHEGSASPWRRAILMITRAG